MTTERPLFSRIINRISKMREPEVARALNALTLPKGAQPILGWSMPIHYAFFESVAAEISAGANVLICGVYHGLDLKLFQIAVAAMEKQYIGLTGVDLFEAGPLPDWSEEQKARGTWEANQFGPPPDMEAAKLNAPGALIFKDDASHFMGSTPHLYDVIYLDTSHDYETVQKEIKAARAILSPGGIICGDDYCEVQRPWWGVDRAVTEALPHHVALWDRIWVSP